MDTLIRLAIIAALTPFWWPLVKTLLDEGRALLRGTGHISEMPDRRGPEPRGIDDDELISIPRGDARARGPRRLGTRGFRTRGEGLGARRRRLGA